MVRRDLLTKLPAVKFKGQRTKISDKQYLYNIGGEPYFFNKIRGQDKKSYWLKYKGNFITGEILRRKGFEVSAAGTFFMPRNSPIKSLRRALNSKKISLPSTNSLPTIPITTSLLLLRMALSLSYSVSSACLDFGWVSV